MNLSAFMVVRSVSDYGSYKTLDLGPADDQAPTWWSPGAGGSFAIPITDPAVVASVEVGQRLTVTIANTVEG